MVGLSESSRTAAQTPRLRIAIVEGRALLRDVLSRICAKNFGYEIVTTAANGPAAVKAILRTAPDLVLLAFGLPGFDGVEVLARVRRRSRLTAKIIIVAADCDRRTVQAVSRAQVQGFFDIGSQVVGDLREALAAVAAGKLYFSKSYGRVLGELRRDPVSFYKVLTGQEFRIAGMVGKLVPDSKIRIRLRVSQRTLEWHFQNIMEKLGVHSRLDLIRWAAENGFLAERF